jgi:hypothetical protein
MALNTAPASCCRVGIQCPCVEQLMQLREFYWLQNPLIFQVNLKVARICAAVMWRQKYARQNIGHLYIHKRTCSLLAGSSLHDDTCRMYCTNNMLVNHRTEYCQAGAIISCYASTDVCSAASSSMLNAGLLGSNLSCTPCPLQIPIAS